MVIQDPHDVPRVRVPKSAELVAANLRRQIVRGALVEGDALPPEAVLMEKFAVSRPTLREAFRVLESEALITVRRGAHGGAQVHSPDVSVAARYAGLVLEHQGATIADVFEASAAIETYTLRQVAATITKKQIATLRLALTEADAADTPHARVRAQDNFHLILVGLVGNHSLSVVAQMLRHIVNLANTSRVDSEPQSPANERATRKGQRTHEKLVELLEAKDIEGAVELWDRHLHASEDHVAPGLKDASVLDLLG